MIYLHKILPVFVLPTGIVLLLLVASVALRRRALAAAAAVLLWLSSMSLVSDRVMRAAEGWSAQPPLQSVPAADAVVVLSGGLERTEGPAGQEEWAEGVDRFEGGLALMRAGKAPVLVFTAGWLPWEPGARPEGDVLRERAIERGIPDDRILVGGGARNTEEESRAVSALLRSRSGPARVPSVILVTSAFHMRRSRLMFERAGLSVTPYPVDFQTSPAGFSFMDLLPHGGSIANTELAIREFYGYLYYRFVKTG